jgi:two-component system sensor histidine kinase/response regulator
MPRRDGGWRWPWRCWSPWLLARRMRRSIADPIAKLIHTAQKVSASQNYTLRIVHQRSDELGTLIDSFNNMLAQVEGRGAELTHHRDELERQVGVRTEQLERAKNAAEAASRAKSAFLATMSHEIRTPMNGVLGMTEMLLGTGLTDTQRNYTQLVKQSGEHLLVIINDILDFSKIEAGKLTVEYINFNLWDLLDDIHTVYTPQAEGKGIALHFEIANDIPVAICGDPNRLRQIMANLLGNAIKFTDQGRILARVRIASEDNQAVMLRFEVHDTGIGVSRDAGPHLRSLFAGRRFDHPQVRRHRPGAGDLEAAGRADGRRDRRRQRAAARLGVLVHGGLRQAPRRSGRAGRPPAHPRRPARAGGRQPRTSRIGLERHLAAWRVDCDSADSADEALARLHAAARAGRPTTPPSSTWNCSTVSGLLLAATIKPTRHARHAPDPAQSREAGGRSGAAARGRRGLPADQAGARGRPVRLPGDAPARPGRAGAALRAAAGRCATPAAGARAARAAGRGQPGQRRSRQGHAGEPGPAGRLRAQRRRSAGRGACGSGKPVRLRC